jgi:hypothetical protein
MNKYSDYFEIDPKYYPVIDESSIKEGIDWKRTFPHKTFIDLLKATERMLARSSNLDKRSVWIEGAYGTGKSLIAWTLKNLLDCHEKELKDYFDKYSTLKVETDLRDRLITHKKDTIVTAYRFSSGGIIGDRALVMAVYESVTKALRDAGIKYKGENTLRGGVAAWISDPKNKVYFESLITEPEYRGLGSFAGKSTDDIIKLLNDPTKDVQNLISDIFSLADDRGITALSTNMDQLISWITDIIDHNKLKAIVLVWDEFSSYFKNNRTTLDEFQKLAYLASHKPFYLMIVTHMSGSIFGADQTGSIVRDRFVRKEIELPDSIAFELIGDALKVKDVHKEMWDNLSDDLNDRVKFVRDAVCKSVLKSNSRGEEIIKDMLPLHPLAALLLKNISSAFASNQRSMFNFIKAVNDEETKNLQAFQWFIASHSPDDGDILSIDYLWNFFYEAGKDEYGVGAGRTNLDTMIRIVLDTYPKNESRLNREEIRVLKTVLMMQAISQKLGDSVDLFLPTDQNINYAFEGTDLENGRAVNLAKKLVQDGILYKKPMGGGKSHYAAAAVSGDQEQIDKIKVRIASEKRTSSLVTDGNLSQALPLNSALKFRYEVTPITIDNFTATINKISNDDKTYRFKAVLSFARSDEEHSKIRSLVKLAVLDDRYEKIVFIDVSATLMGADRFEQWVEYAANEEYWRPKDGKLADQMSRKAKDILEEWRNDISSGLFTIFSSNMKTGEAHNNIVSVYEALFKIILQTYPLSYDNAKVSEQMWTDKGFLAGAKNGIIQSCGGIYQSSFIVSLMQNAWGVPNYWEAMPKLPISKLKIIVDQQINSAFEKDGRISIGSIFDGLIEQGFMPCNLYAFFTGFLLKEYATDSFRYSDGDTGDKMNADKLAEIINEYIKQINTPLPRYKEKFIEVMTHEQKAFIEFSKIVFDVPDNISIEQAALRIRSKLKDFGYPIWAFKGIDTNSLELFIDNLTTLANPMNKGTNESKIASEIGKMYLQTPTAANNLANLLASKNAPKAMEDFLTGFENGDILNLAKSINVSDVLQDVKRQVGSGEALWLWDQETGEEELRKLIQDYKIVLASNNINQKTNSLSVCLAGWQDKLKSIKIPVVTLLSEIPSLKILFEILRDIASTGDLVYEKRAQFLAELEKNTENLQTFFDTKIKIFSNIYSVHLKGFSDDDINNLYSKLPFDSFIFDMSDFEKRLVGLAAKFKAEQEKFKLHSLWEDKTSSKTPLEWANKYNTPPLALVPFKLQDGCRRVFDAINRNNPEENEVIFALDFLNNHLTILSFFNYKAKIDEAFLNGIIGRYKVLLPEIGEVRSYLKDAVTAGPYDWYGNLLVQTEIEKLAKSKYNLGGSDKVLAHIEKMDADKAKKYLKELIKDNMNVGIEIISDESIK